MTTPTRLAATLTLALLLAAAPPLSAQDEAIDLFDPSISACSSAPDAAWYYQINGGSDERCQIEDIRAPLPSVAFKTLDAPSGTDPVADAKDDTLTLTCSDGITCTGDSATDALALSSSGLAPYGQYDPNRPPTSCAVCEEFTGDVESLTWEDGNMESATLTIEKSGARLTGDGADDDMNVQWVTPPSSGNTDFTVTAKIRLDPVLNNTTTNACGIAILESGTTGTPTELTALYWINAATDGVYYATTTSYAFAGAATVDSIAYSEASADTTSFYFQLRYVDATRVTTAVYGFESDVANVAFTSTTTLSADPLKIGYFVRQGGGCFIEFFRARTDADRNLAGE